MRGVDRAGGLMIALTLLTGVAPVPGTYEMSDATTPAAPVSPGQETPSIGQATMEPDATIILRLRAASPTAIGDALLRYPPDHPQYKSILDHLGGLTPGESKPVPPFN
jgi:hypothetical protein